MMSIRATWMTNMQGKARSAKEWCSAHWADWRVWNDCPRPPDGRFLDSVWNFAIPYLWELSTAYE